MEHRNLGNSGLQVSVAGLGTNNFGRRSDYEHSVAVINKAIDLGINFIDTADVYGQGQSEEYIGRALQGRRRDLILATKFESPMGEGPLWKGASRRYLFEAVQASLKRLQVDYIDLYQVHYPDPNTPVEETMNALDDLVRRGDIRYIGCSNFAAWQVVEAQWVAKAEHLSPFISAQNYYNLLHREVEDDLVSVCKKYGLGVIPYFPLEGGVLTGKYRPNEPAPEGTRFAGSGPAASRFLNDRNFAMLSKFEEFAANQGHTVAELALAWLGSQSQVSSVIAGATRPEQVEDNVRALEWRLTPEDLKELDVALAGEVTPA